MSEARNDLQIKRDKLENRLNLVYSDLILAVLAHNDDHGVAEEAREYVLLKLKLEKIEKEIFNHLTDFEQKTLKAQSDNLESVFMVLMRSESNDVINENLS